jgi:uncharacterized protein (TIGR02231 family)
MNRTILILSILFISSITFAKEDKKNVASAITHATVFQQGAQIEREAEVQITRGTHQLIIKGLPGNIDENSLQVTGTGNFSILGITFQKDYGAKKQNTPEIKELKDSLKLLKQQKNENQNLLSIYQKEEDILMANKKISGTNAGLDINELKSAMTYFRAELREIKEKELEVNDKLNRIKKSITRIEKQLKEITGQSSPRGEVHVRIASENDQNIKLNLNYVLMNAGWQPLYDLRATDINNPVKLIYKAKIYQSTGIEWRDIPVTISTGKANASNTQPQLSPKYLRFFEPAPRYNRQRPQAAMKKMQFEQAEAVSAPRTEADRVQADMKTTQTRVEFHPEQKQTIPGNGKEFTIHLTSHTLDAEYTYYTVPKLDNDAFLLAKVSEWEEYNLIPAKANLFFEGRFVGSSFFNTNTTSDTLTFSLGKDKSIIVKHEKLKDYETEKFIGKNKKISYERNIQVKNTKQNSIDIIIKDQIPVSTHEDITVEPLDLSNAKLNKEKGFLTWNKTIQPNQTEELTIKYSIEYPKDKKINY